jgi:hypothetical protein
MGEGTGGILEKFPRDTSVLSGDAEDSTHAPEFPELTAED